MKKIRRIKILGGIPIYKDVLLTVEQVTELNILRNSKTNYCDKESPKWSCWLPRNHTGPCFWWSDFVESNDRLRLIKSKWHIVDTWNE